MKRIFLMVVVLVCFSNLYSQQKNTCKNSSCIVDTFAVRFNRLLPSYKCDSGVFVSQKAFFEIAKQVFSKVVIKNDDLVKNGTATSLTIDKDKSTLSGNANFKLSNGVFGNIGMAGNTQGRQLSFFQNAGFNRGFTISPGLDIKWKSSIFYDDDTCERVKNLRVLHLKKLLKQMDNHKGLDTTKLIKDSVAIADTLFAKDLTKRDTLSLTQYEEKEKALKKIKDSLLFYRTYLSNVNNVDSIIEDEISNFETKNAPIGGYTLHWFNLNGSFSNQGYNLFDTSITNHFFNDTLKSEYYRIYAFNFTYNYARNSPKLLLYGYIGFSVQNQFGLQDFTYKNSNLIGGVSSVTQNNSIEALDVTQITGAYNKSYLGFTPQAGGFMFFGKSKAVGFEAFASVNIKSKTPELIEHRPAYSFRFGGLFSLTRSEGVVSNGTVGLMLTANNWVFGKNTLNDVLSFSVRLGIPFSNIKGF